MYPKRTRGFADCNYVPCCFTRMRESSWTRCMLSGKLWGSLLKTDCWPKRALLLPFSWFHIYVYVLFFFQVKDLISNGFNGKGRFFSGISFSPVYIGETSTEHSCMYFLAYLILFLRADLQNSASWWLGTPFFFPIYLSVRPSKCTLWHQCHSSVPLNGITLKSRHVKEEETHLL